jgi:mono/diheme cytochrome c family protein
MEHLNFDSATSRRAVRCRSFLFMAFAVLGVFCAPAPAGATPTVAAPNSAAEWKQFQKTVQPFLAENCYECHGAKDPENDFRLDVFTNSAALANGRKSLADAYDKILHGEMPPKKKPRPAAAQLAVVVGWLESHLDMGCNGPIDPGRVTLRRLNRAEYNNTIRDLLGVDLHPADAFPTDMSGYGFDNNGDVLTIAPVLMEKYLSAADFVLNKVINAEPVVPAAVTNFDAVNAEGTIPKTIQTTNVPPVAAGANVAAGRGRGSPVGRLFNQRGEIYHDYDFPKDGTYVLRVRAYGTAGSANRERPSVAFYIDGEQVQPPVTIPQDFRNVGVTSLKPIHLTAGKHRITLAFVNGPTAEEVAAAEAAALTNSVVAVTNAAAPVAALIAVVTNTAAPATNLIASAGTPLDGAAARPARPTRPARRGPPPGPPPSPTGKPTLGVIYFEAEGPTELTPDRMPGSYNRLMIAQPSDTVTKAQAAEQIIRPFTSRAFRRPVREDEVQQLMAFWKQADDAGHTFNESLQLTLKTVLTSPQFLFRVEAEPQPGEPGNIHTLDDYELASRLSYFLWSTMPDDELFKLAAAGKLRANLQAQVQRMLKDPRSQALVENFAGQWLQLRQMQNVSPDATLFPGFDDSLRTAMTQETEMFFNSIIQEDRSVLDFLGANYTFVNERLAKHYGLSGIKGDDFQRVTFSPDDHRGGLLTEASILTITSYPNRTSPVQRGKWVLENLLDDAPPPPPPNVPALAEDAKAMTGTMRERMEQHRTNPQCAACHARMDPIGFSLENFDAIGAWRTNDVNNQAIDVSGQLPDGTTFNGPAQLKNIIMLQKDKFARTLTSKMLTFALGRGLEDQDRCIVDGIETALQQNGYRFSVLVNEIVNSDPFQKRSGKPETQTALR